QQLQPSTGKYKPLRRFPESAFDLSVITPMGALIGEVQSAIEKLAGQFLLSVSYLREFALESGQRSLSYRVTIGAPDRTLSADEAGEVRAGIIDGLRAAGYELRL